jgi:signal transduction histidine kinase
VPPDAVIGAPEEMRQRDEQAAALLDLIAEVYQSGGAVTRPGPEFAAVLPLHGPHTGHRSVLVLRRPPAALSYHDVLPQDADRPFLNLVGQTVGATLVNAQLVSSLKKSYGELERAQRELVARERLAAIGELAAVVAHEVRNPLGVIFNAVSALNRLVPPGPDASSLLDIVREEASRVNRTVSDLLEFARPSVLAMHEHELRTLVEDTVASAQSDARVRGVNLTLEVQGEARVVADEHLLRRALLNLIDNATHVSSEGDTIEVRVGYRDHHAFIEVEDGGPGIDEEARPRIFEPFFTTKSVGTGLGLAVVKRFAETHGGEVLIRSGDEAGSVFTIRLHTAPPPLN